jgi:hypothetical protein
LLPNPGRRRRASSPWAENSQAFGLKIAGLNKLPTNIRDAYPESSPTHENACGRDSRIGMIGFVDWD